MRRFVWALVALLGLLGRAHASISYQLVTDQSSYTISTPGSSVLVNVYLQETTTGASTSYLADQTVNGGKGLAGFGLLVTKSGGSGDAVLGTAVKNTADFNGNFVVNPNGGTQVGITGDGGTAPGAVGTTNGLGNSNGRTVLLASLNISANSGTTNYILNDYSNAPGKSGVNDTLAFKTLDGFNANFNGSDQGAPVDWTGTIANGNFSFSVSVAAVPEPSSMLLCGLAACGMGVGAWRRRRAKAAAASDVPPVAIA